MITIIPIHVNADFAAGILPPSAKLNLMPNKTVRRSFEVINKASERLILKVTPILSDKKAVYTASKWLKISPTILKIPGDDYSMVRYEITVPEGTPKGSYKAKIRLAQQLDTEGEEGEGEGEEKQMAAGIRITGSLVYTVFIDLGKPAYEGRIVLFKATADKQDIKFSVQVQNESTFAINTRGKVIIKKEGRKIKEVPMSGRVIPKGTKTIETKIKNDLAPGAYAAEISLNIGGRKKLQSVSNFKVP